MAAKTWTEIAEAARDAIHKIMTHGQSHSAEGRSLTRADLPSLIEAAEHAERMASREAGEGISIRAGTPIDA